MRAWLHVGLLVVVSGALTAVALGQSVAEAARQEQERQGKPQSGRRVYTNDDFPARLPEIVPAVSPQDENSPPAARQSKKPSADQVRAAVLTQKQKVRALDARVADLQRQLDEWANANLSITCDPYSYYNPYQSWCDTPKYLYAELNKAKAARDEAQGQLEQIQEEARRMGYRSVVYDPD